MFVLVILLAGVLGVMLRTEEVTAASRSMFRATVLLNEKLEEVRATTFDGVAAAGDGTGSCTISESASGGRAFSWSRSVGPVSGNTNMLKVRVTISWTEGTVPRRVQAVTYVARHGIVNKPV